MTANDWLLCGTGTGLVLWTWFGNVRGWIE